MLMMRRTRFISALLSIFFLLSATGCFQDYKIYKIQAPRPANIPEYASSDIFTDKDPEKEPGTQSDLVAHVGDRVFFDYDSAELSEKGESILAMQADWLRMNPDVTVTIEGHCDERGTREYNIELGLRRAKAVKTFLTYSGVNAERVYTISYGKDYPDYPDNHEVSWSKNRRAVTVVHN